MLRPSYSDLMETVNSNVVDGEHPVMNSRYGIVIATAKRARQIIAGADVLVDNSEGKKPLSTAVDEIHSGKVNLLPEDYVEEAAEVEEVTDAVIEDAAEEEAVEDTEE